MAINPPSDIILDVAKAADPLQYNAAVERLSRIGGVEPPTESFDLLLGSFDRAEEIASAAKAVDWTRADLRSRLEPLTQEGIAGRPLPAHRQFEAFVLQTFLQSMFPKDAEHVFGGGIAGSYWSSMLAEQIAGQVARIGGIGIADQIASFDARSHHPYTLSAILSGEATGVSARVFDFEESET